MGYTNRFLISALWCRLSMTAKNSLGCLTSGNVTQGFRSVSFLFFVYPITKKIPLFLCKFSNSLDSSLLNLVITKMPILRDNENETDTRLVISSIIHRQEQNTKHVSYVKVLDSGYLQQAFFLSTRRKGPR